MDHTEQDRRRRMLRARLYYVLGELTGNGFCVRNADGLGIRAEWEHLITVTHAVLARLEMQPVPSDISNSSEAADVTGSQRWPEITTP